jgi:hypothetical protein
VSTRPTSGRLATSAPRPRLAVAVAARPRPAGGAAERDGCDATRVAAAKRTGRRGRCELSDGDDRGSCSPGVAASSRTGPSFRSRGSGTVCFRASRCASTCSPSSTPSPTRRPTPRRDPPSAGARIRGGRRAGRTICIVMKQGPVMRGEDSVVKAPHRLVVGLCLRMGAARRGLVVVDGQGRETIRLADAAWATVRRRPGSM